MNDTKIEWCDKSWNPITGCLRGCPYCYAEKTALRFGGHSVAGGYTAHMEELKGSKELDSPLFVERENGKITKAPYPFIFEPTLHRYRLNEPQKVTEPKTIFVCSMADMFGAWVKTTWILEVFDACLRVPRHTYLFLTKNPDRYTQLDELALLPREENFWFGTTVTTPTDKFFTSENYNTFLSVEPILASFNNEAVLNGVDWIILGAETGMREDKVIPEKAWIEPIVDFCTSSGIPVFMKNSLIDIWGNPLFVEYPYRKEN